MDEVTLARVAGSLHIHVRGGGWGDGREELAEGGPGSPLATSGRQLDMVWGRASMVDTPAALTDAHRGGEQPGDPVSLTTWTPTGLGGSGLCFPPPRPSTHHTPPPHVGLQFQLSPVTQDEITAVHPFALDSQVHFLTIFNSQVKTVGNLCFHLT